MLANITMLLALAAQPGDRSLTDLAHDAQAAFIAKCTQCHGTDVPHPKSNFGVVNDLTKLVASTKAYVVPGNLAESAVWKEIDEGDMPPDEAKAGPLTDAEKLAIKSWIQAGAPDLTGAVPAKPQSAAEPALTPFARGVRLLGRLHVVVIHFPIAMLAAAAFAEAFGMVRAVSMAATVRFCVWLGTLAAVAAAVLGWVHAMDGFPGPFSGVLTTAGVHRWLGTGAAAFAIVLALLVEQDAKLNHRRWGVRLCIFVGAALVGAAGHFGGLLTHGNDFLTP